MASWSQSQLLQSIGWAIVNSLWQMAFLWCIFLLTLHVFKPSSRNRYMLAVGFLLTGAFWSFYTFVNFEISSNRGETGFVSAISTGDHFISNILSAASMAYLVLLTYPACQLVKNLGYVKRIRTKGLRKADIQYRLFVLKISSRLDIKKKVS